MTLPDALIVAGAGDLAQSIARESERRFSVPARIWESASNEPPSGSLVLVVSSYDERERFVRAGLESGRRIVSLPFRSENSATQTALEDGVLRLVSGLHGVPALERLRKDSVSGKSGRTYGIFAAHRLPRPAVHQVRNRLDDLVAYASSLLDTSFETARVTSATLLGESTDAWFVILRCADETLVTLEVSAVLDERFGPEGTLIVEVTGSDAVLRAEPHRQSVSVTGPGGTEFHTWYSAPAGTLLEFALAHATGQEALRQPRLLQTLNGLDVAAEKNAALDLAWTRSY